LTFFVDCGKARELLIGVVTFPIAQLCIQALREGYLDAAEVTILRGIGGVVTEDIVVRDRLLGLDDAARQIVVIEERLAASVSGQCIERFLRPLEVSGGGEGSGAGVNAGVTLRTLGCIAQGSLGNETARVDRPERNAGLDGGIDRGMKLCLVIDPVQAKAACKITSRRASQRSPFIGFLVHGR
jgi:hypothetical protein